MSDDHTYTVWKARVEGYKAREAAKLELLRRQLADLKKPEPQPEPRRAGGCHAWAG